MGLPICRERYQRISDDITVNLFLLSWAGSFAEKQEKKSTADGGVVHELGKQGGEAVCNEGIVGRKDGRFGWP